MKDKHWVWLSCISNIYCASFYRNCLHKGRACSLYWVRVQDVVEVYKKFRDILWTLHWFSIRFIPPRPALPALPATPHRLRFVKRITFDLSSAMIVPCKTPGWDTPMFSQHVFCNNKIYHTDHTVNRLRCPHVIVSLCHHLILSSCHCHYHITLSSSIFNMPTT